MGSLQRPTFCLLPFPPTRDTYSVGNSLFLQYSCWVIGVWAMPGVTAEFRMPKVLRNRLVLFTKLTTAAFDAK